MHSLRDQHPTLYFVLPVLFENLFSTSSALIFSWLIGGISKSALTSISLGNQIITVICSAMSMLTTGTGILCARLLGADDRAEASKIVEQSLFLATVSGCVITLACLIFANPLLSLLMPNAEAQVLREGVAFFRVQILSLPFLCFCNTVSTALRTSGDSRAPMFVTTFNCTQQLVYAWLFLRVLRLEIFGAGLVYLLYRVVGTALAVFLLRRSHQLHVVFRHALKPDLTAFRRILAIGIPTSVESIFVQAGYLIANSMVIGLGTFEAAVYNVANTLYSFASLVQSIYIPIATTLVGQLIGAKQYRQARRTGWSLWASGMLVSLFISALLLIFAPQLTPIYSTDPDVQKAAAAAMGAVFVMCIPAISLNAHDPQLRVGGDVKYVMYVSVIAVWLVRLPATWLFCYRWNLGASGVFWANTLSLFFRMAFNLVRFIRGKYLYMRV